MDGNTATTGPGGALAVEGASDAFNISRGTFIGNSAKTDGGAVSLNAFAPNATTTIVRTAFQVRPCM